MSGESLAVLVLFPPIHFSTPVDHHRHFLYTNKLSAPSLAWTPPHGSRGIKTGIQLSTGSPALQRLQSLIILAPEPNPTYPRHLSGGICVEDDYYTEIWHVLVLAHLAKLMVAPTSPPQARDTSWRRG